MRMLVKFSVPVEKGNQAFQSGTLQKTVQSMVERLKPEAAYFYPNENGERSAFMVFDMEGSWQIPSIAEEVFQTLNAKIQFSPVMNAEDLQRGWEERG